MAEPFLEPAEEGLLSQASEVGVLAAMIRIAAHEFAQSRWLDPTNRYRDSVLSKIRKDTGGRAKTLAESDVAEYVAASAPLHCSDGWAFLGRALAAHAQGDSDSARHLAYYAELRAGMSTLACYGIGIFEDRHIVIHADGTVSWLRTKPTHVITWLALERWARVPETASVLAELFKPRSVSIETWITSLSGGGSWQPIAARWLESWGLDLSLFGSDRSARNEASYRPTRIAGRRSLDVAKAIEFLQDLWLTFEPTGLTFAQLDLHLLRRSLEAVFRGIHGMPPAQDAAAWEAAIDQVLVANTDEGAGREELRSFLLRRDGGRESRILELAEKAGLPSERDHHLRVMSRAALLLRVASGSCARLLLQAGIVAGDTRFWWEVFGEDRGLWIPGSVPNPISELWADVVTALDDLEDLTANHPEAAQSYSQFLELCARPISVLSRCERIGIWSLAA